MRRVSLLLGAGCLLVAPVAMTAPRAEAPEILFAVDGLSGTLVPGGAPGAYQLTLRGVDPQTLWFTDRPARDSGFLPTGTVAREVVRGRDGPPNAALEIAADGAEPGRVIPLELVRPRYLAARRVLVSPVRLLDEAPAEIGRLAPPSSQPPPTRFEAAHLFIDGVARPRCSVKLVGKEEPKLGVAFGDKLTTDRWDPEPYAHALGLGGYESGGSAHGDPSQGCAITITFRYRGGGGQLVVRTTFLAGRQPVFTCDPPRGLKCSSRGSGVTGSEAGVTWDISRA